MDAAVLQIVKGTAAPEREWKHDAPKHLPQRRKGGEIPVLQKHGAIDVPIPDF